MNQQTMCVDCGSPVGLHRTESNQLELRCACGHRRTVKVARATPEAWQ
jgi:DNA-directed RNA polymerase subunit RPC12/RpoP